MHRTIASVFTFAVLVFGTVAPAAAATQGSPECPNQVGGQLTIDNTQTGVDALPVLATSGGSVAASRYIQRGSSGTLCGIADGSYLLYWTSGLGFDAATSRFTTQAAYQRFSDPFVFQTIKRSRETQYTAFSVTLYGVADGTARTQGVNQAEFPSTTSGSQPSSPPAGQSYQTPNGSRTVDQMSSELRAVGYAGPWDSTSVFIAYVRTTGGTTPPPTASAAPAVPSAPARTAPPTVTTGTLRIVNNSGGSLQLSASGPIVDSWTVPDGQTIDHTLPVGTYQLNVQANCGSDSDTATVMTKSIDIHTYSCVAY